MLPSRHHFLPASVYAGVLACALCNWLAFWGFITWVWFVYPNTSEQTHKAHVGWLLLNQSMGEKSGSVSYAAGICAIAIKSAWINVHHHAFFQCLVVGLFLYWFSFFNVWLFVTTHHRFAITTIAVFNPTSFWYPTRCVCSQSECSVRYISGVHHE